MWRWSSRAGARSPASTAASRRSWRGCGGSSPSIPTTPSMTSPWPGRRGACASGCCSRIASRCRAAVTTATPAWSTCACAGAGSRRSAYTSTLRRWPSWTSGSSPRPSLRDDVDRVGQLVAVARVAAGQIGPLVAEVLEDRVALPLEGCAGIRLVRDDRVLGVAGRLEDELVAAVKPLVAQILPGHRSARVRAAGDEGHGHVLAPREVVEAHGRCGDSPALRGARRQAAEVPVDGFKARRVEQRRLVDVEHDQRTVRRLACGEVAAQPRRGPLDHGGDVVAPASRVVVGRDLGARRRRAGGDGAGGRGEGEDGEGGAEQRGTQGAHARTLTAR